MNHQKETASSRKGDCRTKVTRLGDVKYIIVKVLAFVKSTRWTLIWWNV